MNKIKFIFEQVWDFQKETKIKHLFLHEPSDQSNKHQKTQETFRRKKMELYKAFCPYKGCSFSPDTRPLPCMLFLSKHIPAYATITPLDLSRTITLKEAIDLPGNSPQERLDHLTVNDMLPKFRALFLERHGKTTTVALEEMKLLCRELAISYQQVVKTHGFHLPYATCKDGYIFKTPENEAALATRLTDAMVEAMFIEEPRYALWRFYTRSKEAMYFD
jgi:hypothetical protein